MLSVGVEGAHSVVKVHLGAWLDSEITSGQVAEGTLKEEHKLYRDTVFTSETTRTRTARGE